MLSVVFFICACANDGSNTSKEKYGHWKFKGSSTFPQIFQCVETFKPHQNKECE
jgi:hypothetical protein